MLRKIISRLPLSTLLAHLAMGWTLGMYSALTMVVMDTASVRTRILEFGAPKLAFLGLVLGLSMLFALGASATGLIFVSIDRR